MSTLQYKQEDIDGILASVTREADWHFTVRLLFPGAETPVVLPERNRTKQLRGLLTDAIADAQKPSDRRDRCKWYSFSSSAGRGRDLYFYGRDEVVWIGQKGERSSTGLEVVFRHPVSVDAAKKLFELLYAFADQE